MRSELPKVLHALAGRPMISWVLDAIRGAGVDQVVVVVGHGADRVREVLPDGVSIAVQEEQNGTGHATQVGLAELGGQCDSVVVACGDTPLLREALIRRLLEQHRTSGDAATMVTAVLDDAGSYGRVLRDATGAVTGVVEARDASPEQLEVREINSGLFCFDRPGLQSALARVDSDNAQGEVYLPDALPLMGGSVGALVAEDTSAVDGVNTRVDLAACERVLQDRLREALMLEGVTMPDPTAVYLDADVTVGADTILYPGVHLRAGSTVGSGCAIGPDVVASGSTIADGAQVVSAHIIDSRVGPGCVVGPFGYLRPETVMEEGAKVGTFVEVKKSTVGPGAKIPHLSYIGDATIGEGSNIGAGNITANYDGFRKHRTVVGERVKTGSDCVFVAPVTIGDDTMTGAGSIVTDDVPDGALAIARARQTNIEGFTARAEQRAREAAEAERNGGA
jgi:bifunctional UDP-N-acetylglucosamine pyrophosphorylase/glucosamine-1-phosphate N-acetyltransferase